MKKFLLIFFLSSMLFAQGTQWSNYPRVTSLESGDVFLMSRSLSMKGFLYSSLLSSLRTTLDTAYTGIHTDQFIYGKKRFVDSVSFRKNVFAHSLVDFSSATSFVLPTTLGSGEGALSYSTAKDKPLFRNVGGDADTVLTSLASDRIRGKKTFGITSLIDAQGAFKLTGRDTSGVGSANFVYSKNGHLYWRKNDSTAVPLDSAIVGTADTSLAYTWTGLHQWTQDSIKIGGLWYDYPTTRIANSVLYDSLGNGILKWKVYGGSSIDTTKISYLAKAETFTGAKTFNASPVLYDVPLVLKNSTNSFVSRLYSSVSGSDINFTLPATGGNIPTGSGTANEIAYWSTTNALGSLTTGTYPSLTELSYVKGLTSSAQSQINGKQTQLNGTGFVKASGTTISYDNSTYSVSTHTQAEAYGGFGSDVSSVGVGLLKKSATNTYTNVTDNSSNWNTAYGWGNHASAGYITSGFAHFSNTSNPHSVTASQVGAVAKADSTGWGYATQHDILNKITLTSLSSTATGLTYTNTTGAFSLTSGYVIPTTTEQTNWGTAYTNRITSLTTTGSSGAATLTSNTLNVPQYTLAGLGGIGLSSLSGTSPITYNSGTGAIGFDQTANLNLSGTITNSGTFKYPGAGSGANGYVLNQSGIFGYSATLGTVFSLPTDGSAPTFASGIINSVTFNLYNASVIRTSATVGDGSASSAGILMNDTGIYGVGANQLTANANFKLLTSTGEIQSKLGTIGGWTIGSTSLTSTNIGFHSGASSQILLGHATDYATSKIGLKNDGSGKLASGNFSWDASGNVTASGTWTNSATITGGTIQTATANQRIVLDGTTNRINIYSSHGDAGYIYGYWNGVAEAIAVNGYFYAGNRISAANGITSGGDLNAGLNKFTVDSSGRITIINNTNASATTGYSLVSDGTSFTPRALTSTDLNANVSATEFGYLDGVTSAIQTQIDTKPTIAYGEMYENGTGTAHAYDTEWGAWTSSTTGDCSGVTYDATADKLTVATAGVYEVSYTMSYYTNQTNDVYWAIFKNGLAGTELTRSKSIQNATNGITHNISGKCYVSLSANDYIILAMYPTDAFSIYTRAGDVSIKKISN